MVIPGMIPVLLAVRRHGGTVLLAEGPPHKGVKPEFDLAMPKKQAKFIADYGMATASGATGLPTLIVPFVTTHCAC